MSRSVALMIVGHHEGPQGSVDWLKTVGLGASSLDADGKFFLLKCLYDLADWKVAEECLDVLTDSDLRVAPVLHYIVAMTRLLSTVPDELRTVALGKPPILAADFPLDSAMTAIEVRRVARGHFLEAETAARRLGCSLAATRAQEYALWLELRDPEGSAKGRKRLESRLHDLKSGLHFVYLGLQFGVDLDLEAVHREIERQIALNGEITADAAHARLALAFAQETSEDFANYITRYRHELAAHFDEKQIQFHQIEMFLRAGLPETATESLDALVKQGLSEAEEKRLRADIVEVEATDPIEVARKRFKGTDSLVDLIALVEGLEAKNKWDGLCKYTEILFKRTRSLANAERLGRALHNARRNKRLVEFLRSHRTLVERSKLLKLMFCWSLYHEGALLEARSGLSQVDEDWDNSNYRALQVHLAIALGDWNYLSVFVANECSQRDKRNPQNLIAAAELAVVLDLRSAKELIYKAAGKGNEDARVLASAYFLATRAGWEDDPEVFRWFERAAILSADEGPIQKLTLKELRDRIPAWGRRGTRTREQLSRGKIPMFLAAEFMNRPLFSEMIFPALVNMTENDPRRRYAIPAYSGVRPPVPFDTCTTVGIDVNALITLGFLNLLDDVLDAFDAIVIPHSTLAWLFREKRMVRFHQPSRIKDARQVRNLLSTGRLGELMVSVKRDGDLSAQVGEELALLIGEATQFRENVDSQRIVVRPYPVYRIASLMEEEVDLTEHANVLSSCQSIVDRLRQMGRITAGEERKASKYLQIHEKPWPNQPEIADKAILYLDEVAMAYFLHLEILGKLHAAGYRPIISSRAVSETNALISYEHVSVEVDDIIERIRSAVSSRIESGKIKVGRRAGADETAESSIFEHLALELVSLARQCDAIISDDRFVNQHPNIEGGGGQASMLTTLDLVDLLVSTGSMASEARLEYRTRLRRAGYFFIPVDAEELKQHLHASTVQSGRIIETAELRAIRESMLHVRMSKFLQFPKENFWLVSLLQVFVRVLRKLWRSDADLSITRARSDWIVDQIDVRGWAHRFGGDDGDKLVEIDRGKYILLILTPPNDVPDKVKKVYWNWAEDRILAPIKEQYPDLYSRLVERERMLIEEMAEEGLTGARIQ